MKLALDTNAYRDFMAKEEKVFFAVRSASKIFLPVPVLAELRYGFINGTKTLQNEVALIKFLDSPRVEILPCDNQTTHVFARLKQQLKKHGTPISYHDIWIAALVLQHELVLLSRDPHFDYLVHRVPENKQLID